MCSVCSADFEEKLQQMGFSVEGDDEGHKASVDLTPYKNKKEETPKKPQMKLNVEVQEKVVTKIIFDQPERVTEIV